MDYEKSLETIKQIAREAGQIVLSHYTSPTGIERKVDNTLVSDADKLSSNFIKNSLRKNFPEAAIMDEESKADQTRYGKEFCFFVDPLDDTRGYLAKEDTFSILIGLTKNFEPVLGVCYKPFSDQMFYAIKGQGAYQEDSEGLKRIFVSNTTDINVLISKSRESAELDAILRKTTPTSIIKLGGSAKTIEIARGNGNLFICPKSSPMHLWDLCAPQIILEESGGVITDLEGKAIDYSSSKTQNDRGILAGSSIAYLSARSLVQ